jgi:hypothetical protein
MTSDAPLPPGVPRDYRLTLPDSWFRELAARQFRGLDGAPLMKARLRRHLADRAEAAWQVGGIELYPSLMAAGPLPLEASLLVTLVPPPPGGSMSAESPVVVSGGPGRSAELLELPAGRAVRVRHQGARVSAETPSANLDVYLRVPGSGAWLLLSFAATAGQLAAKMLTLFDAIAATVRWRD